MSNIIEKKNSFKTKMCCWRYWIELWDSTPYALATPLRVSNACISPLNSEVKLNREPLSGFPPQGVSKSIFHPSMDNLDPKYYTSPNKEKLKNEIPWHIVNKAICHNCWEYQWVILEEILKKIFMKENNASYQQYLPSLKFKFCVEALNYTKKWIRVNTYS